MRRASAVVLGWLLVLGATADALPIGTLDIVSFGTVHVSTAGIDVNALGGEVRGGVRHAATAAGGTEAAALAREGDDAIETAASPSARERPFMAS